MDRLVTFMCNTEENSDNFCSPSAWNIPQIQLMAWKLNSTSQISPQLASLSLWLWQCLLQHANCARKSTKLFSFVQALIHLHILIEDLVTLIQAEPHLMLPAYLSSK